MDWLKTIKKSIKYRMDVYNSAPGYIKERWLYGIKMLLRPYFDLPIWVTTTNGTKVFLGSDIIDQYILDDLYVTMKDRYFPDYLDLEVGDRVLDVGGHHGLFAVDLLARFPGTKIVSIEPDPEGVTIIQKHVKKNNADANISVIPYALGLSKSEGYLTDNNDGSWGKTLESGSRLNSIKVKVIPLSSAIVNDASKVKFIKSNCEGGEFDLIPQVIKLGLKPDLIILMIHPQRGDSSTLINSLINYGYQSKLIWESKVNPCWHFIRENKDSIS